MSSISDRASASARRGQVEEKREIDFFVRAKTGPGRKDWSPVGVAFVRDDGKPGYVIKLNTLPIAGSGWNGSLVLVPPFPDQDSPTDEDYQP